MSDETLGGTGQPATAPAPALASITTVSPLFKMVFIGILILTVILLGVNIALAVFIDAPTEAEKELTDRVQTAWQLGFTGLLGLVGGKAVP